MLPATCLRLELIERNRLFARRYGLPVCETCDDPPVACYLPFAEDTRHGNFLDPSYRAILRNPEWKRRLAKPHASARGSLPGNLRRWMEHDSGNSSDALLMNLFCYPGFLARPAAAALLQLETPVPAPRFGIRARVPLANHRQDRTELDMVVGSLMVEAKLTEGGFSAKDAAAVENYRDFREVFDPARLSVESGGYRSYQLLRNVLAAHASQASFLLLVDARRPDLREAWFRVAGAIRPLDLRLRCRLLTWQELAAPAQPRLRRFLEEKYGIVPAA